MQNNFKSRGAVILATLLLAGCGGGSADVGVRVASPPPPQFVFWNGSVGGAQVIDVALRTYTFFADTGCLYNALTRQENTAFCLIPGSNSVNYGAFHGQINNVLLADGNCQAAFIDSATGNFISIELDAFGREVVATTQSRPAFCGR